MIEGVTYDSTTNLFTFYFEQDNENFLIKLENVDYAITQFRRCFYYGYKFSNDIDSKVKAEFTRHINFPENFKEAKDLQLFIHKAVDYLDSQITLPQYNVVIYPLSMSELNRQMLSYLTRITTVKYVEMELIKELPSKIEFDYDRYKIEVLDSQINGRPRFTPQQKENSLQKIYETIDAIHQNNYFSIAIDVNKKFRQFINRYFILKDDESKKLFESLTNNNILLIEDIETSRTTIFHILNSLRTINDKNNIAIFSLIS